MEIVGKLTADATVHEVKSVGRKVVNFSIAINDRYQPKGGEVKKFITYFNCSYWINPGIAEHLTKGSLVELNGRVSVNAWKNAEGEAKGSLNFHVNSIKLHGKGKPAGANAVSLQPQAESVKDDLPF
jgi:single-strand DNA-binding protein